MFPLASKCEILVENNKVSIHPPLTVTTNHLQSNLWVFCLFLGLLVWMLGGGVNSTQFLQRLGVWPGGAAAIRQNKNDKETGVREALSLCRDGGAARGWRSCGAASGRDAAAQVLQNRLGSFGNNRCPRSTERIPFQTETPVGQEDSPSASVGHRRGSWLAPPTLAPHLRLVHRPSSGGTFSTSLLDRSRVDRVLSFSRPLGSTPSTWLLPSRMVSRETM